jgi:hypothetical protein
MEITVNNSNFKKLFLEQLSKISDSVVINVEKDYIESKTCTADNSVILGVKFPIKCTNFTSTILNVGDIKKLIKAFDCIDSEDIAFKIENNNITYADKNIKFKYHLLENNIINQPKINLNKLDQINFEGSFNIQDKSLLELVKASTFSTDSNKVYLTSTDNTLRGNLTDKARYNVDSFEVLVSENYDGVKLENFCLNFEVFRILSTNRFNKFNCKIAPKMGVVLFAFENNIITSKYIVSALTK